MIARIAAMSLVGMLACASLADAQIWRSVRVDRSTTGTAALDVQVMFGEGSFMLRPSETTDAYSVQLRYDAARSFPRHSFDPASGKLVVGTRKEGGKLGLSDENTGETRLELPANTPASLVVDVGAATSNLELGGLALSKLHLNTSASQMNLNFDKANTRVLESFVIDGSASFVEARGLANARASNVDVHSNLGTLDLAFDGDWTADMSASIRIVLASAVLRVPRDVGVEIHVSRVLSSFPAPDGFRRDGDVYRSSNWNESARKLSIRAHSVFGRITVRRTAG